jgi:hypothetical protein
MGGSNSDTIGAAAGIGAGLGGAMGAGMGRMANKELYEQMLRLQMQDMNAYGGLTEPQLKKLVAEQMGPSAFGDIQEDAGTVAAQRAALARLSSIAGQGGMDAMGRASLEQGRQAAAGMASGARQAARSRAASRGMMGSGAEMAAESGADSAAVGRLSQSGYDTAAAAQGRNMQAIQGSGALAGSIRGQDYKKAADLAAARDEIAYHNMQNRTDANKYNALLPQEMWENHLKRLDAQSKARGRLSGYLGGQAQTNIDTTQGVGQAMGGVVGTAAGVAGKVNGMP